MQRRIYRMACGVVGGSVVRWIIPPEFEEFMQEIESSINENLRKHQKGTVKDKQKVGRQDILRLFPELFDDEVISDLDVFDVIPKRGKRAKRHNGRRIL